jgi:hypothetical protein
MTVGKIEKVNTRIATLSAAALVVVGAGAADVCGMRLAPGN